MRKLYIVLLSILFISTVFKAEAQTTVLSENFENGIPSTWSKVLVAGTQEWSISSTTVHEGTKSAYLPSGIGRVSKLLTPVLDLTDANLPVVLSFYNQQLAGASGTSDSLIVYYKSTPTSDWKKLASFGATTRFEKREVQLAEVSATYQIAFEARSKANNGVYIDDVKIQGAPLCANPENLFITEGTSTSIRLNWIISPNWGVTTDSYRLIVSSQKLGDLSSATGNIFDNNITSYDNSYPISGLSPNVVYYVYLKANCTSQYKGNSEWVTFQFTTPCNPMQVPVSEDFNSSLLPSCWLSGGTSTIKPETSSEVAFGGSGNSLKLTGDLYNDTYIASPPLAHRADSLSINFRLSASNPGTNVQILLLSDPFDLSTAISVKTITVESANEWQEYELYTTQLTLPNENYYVVFYLSAGENASIYIDDCTISGFPSCPRVQDLVFSNVTDSSVTLAWEEWGNATSWVIEYTSTAGTFTQTANSNPYTLTGLSDDMLYTVGVRATCGSLYNTHPVSFATICAKRTLPFTENFETITSGIPACWRNNEGTTTDEASKWSLFESNGNKLLRFNSTNTNVAGNTNELYTPQLNFTSFNGTPTLYFDYKNDVDGDLSVLISTNGGNTFTTLADNLKSKDIWESKEINLANYANQNNVVIAFKGISKGVSGAYIYLDNIKVTHAPSCPKPENIQLEEIQSTSATFTWTPKGNENTWHVKITTPNNDVNFYNVTGTPSLTISGLTPDNPYSYIVAVNALCSATDSSAYSNKKIDFKTDCTPISIAAVPFVDNFDNHTTATYATGIMPPCWNIVWTSATTTADRPQIYNYAQFATSSTFSFRMNAISTVALPATDIPFNKLRVRFDLKFTYLTTQFTIGVADNLTDTLSFTPIETVVTSDVSKWVNVKVPFDRYTGTGKYIVFRNDDPNPWGANIATVYIDNLILDTIPSCPDIETTDWTVKAISHSELELVPISNFDQNGWEVEYGADGFTLGTGTRVVLTEDTLKINGLTELTNYNFYVRKICSNNNYGVWSNVKSVKTEQIPVTIPYLCNFDNASENGWLFASGTAKAYWMIGNNTYATGNQSLYVTTDGSTNTYQGFSYIQGSVWAYRLVDIPVEGSYRFGFNWKSLGEASDYARAFLIPSNETIAHAIDEITPKATWIPLDGNKKLNLNATWQRENNEVYVDKAGKYNIAFLWRNNASGVANPPAAIDSITFVAVSACKRPQIIAPTNMGETSVTLNWISSGDNCRFILADRKLSYNELATPAPAGVLIDSVTTVYSMNLSNLDNNNTYYYYVKSYCGSDSSMWSIEASFKTDCSPASIPFVENFEVATSSSFDCWDALSGKIVRNATYKYKGTNSGYFSDVSAISPRMDVNSLVGYQLSGFAYSANENANFLVGIIKNKEDISTYEPVASVVLPLKNKWNEFIVDFNFLSEPGYEAVADAQFFMIDVSSNQAIYLDSLVLKPIDQCAQPQNLTTNIIDGNTVELDWVGASENSWNVTLLLKNQLVLDTVVSSHPLRLEKLNPFSEYTYNVRAVCSANDSSKWSESGFITPCGILQIPYSEGFENFTTIAYTTNIFPSCWTLVNSLNPNGTCLYGYASYASSGTYSFQFGQNGIVAMPEIEDISSLRLEFNARTFNVDYKLEIGVIENLDDPATFVPIDLLNGAASANILMHKIVDFDLYAGSGKHIAFRNSGYFYMDDVTINKMPECAEVLDNRWNVSLSEDTVVLVAVNDSRLTDWIIEYGPSGFNKGSGTTIVVNNAYSYEVSGLAHATTYDFYVRKICDNAPYSTVKSIMTRQVPATLPYFANFESGASDWVLENGTQLNKWICGTAARSDGSNSLYISNTGTTYNYTYGASYTYAYRMFNFEANKTYNIQYDWKSYQTLAYYQSRDLLRAFLIPTEIDITAGNAYGMTGDINTIPTGWIEVSGISNNAQTWTAHSKTITDVSGNYYLAFFWKSIGGGTAPGAVDNVLVEAVCSSVDGEIDFLTSNRARLSIESSNNNFRVVLSTTTLTNPNENSAAIVKDTTFTSNAAILKGLTAETPYYAYIRSICGPNDSSAWSLVNFTTPQPSACDGVERNVSDEICAGYDYVANGFDISKSELRAGNNQFSFIKLATNAANCDTTMMLNLNVLSENITIIRDTICSGGSFNEHGFIGLSTQGIYEHSLSNAYGCDSLVRLVLSVVEIRTELNETICEGNSVAIGEETFTETGIYERSFPSATGCDSIVTLNLYVLPLNTLINKDLCLGETYQLGDTLLASTGIYTRRLTNKLNCDSIITVDLHVYAPVEHIFDSFCAGGYYNFKDTVITSPGIYVREQMNPAGCKTRYELTLTQTEPQSAVITDMVCKGVGYNGYGFVGLMVANDTILTQKLTSTLTGCDSINEIHLSVIEPITETIIVNLTEDDLPYNFCGNSLTQPGTYICNDISEVTGCDSITTLVLNINSGINDILTSKQLVVSPNPVRRNELVSINYEFNETERNGLKVDIINSLGQIVKSITPTDYPIKIQGLNTPGFYLIIVKTGNGSFYNGEIIVK